MFQNFTNREKFRYIYLKTDYNDMKQNSNSTWSMTIREKKNTFLFPLKFYMVPNYLWWTLRYLTLFKKAKKVNKNKFDTLHCIGFIKRQLIQSWYPKACRIAYHCDTILTPKYITLPNNMCHLPRPRPPLCTHKLNIHTDCSLSNFLVAPLFSLTHTKELLRGFPIFFLVW